MKKISVFLIFFLTVLCGCVTTSPKIINVATTQHSIEPLKADPVLKRKVAIARFGNEAQYGKSALFGTSNSYNAEKQATDILSAKLTQSGKFILLERNDIHLINDEAGASELLSLNIGADYLIVGSVTEFGRKNMSDVGVFARSKIQTAYAKVSVRLIEVKTGQIIFAQEGSGESRSEAGKAFGLGKHVGYDSTLNDKALSAAIGSVVNGIMENLLSKPWRSYLLSINNDNVIIAGGVNQGLNIGDTFSVYKKGDMIKNPQTGILIELPGSRIATIKVISQFGSTYTDEGSVCSILDGSLIKLNKEDLYVEK